MRPAPHLVAVAAAPVLGTGRACLGLALLAALALAGCAQSLPSRPPGADLPAATPPAAAPAPAAPGSAYAADVARLRSADFVERQRAAERLVDAGTAALEELGRAGPSTVAGPGGVRVSTTRPVVQSILGQLDADGLPPLLEAPWPLLRAQAAEELGRRGRLGAVPDLIVALDDEVPEVRSAAVSALRRLTLRTFGYRPRASLAQRAAARERWWTWWRVEGRRRVADEDGKPAG